MSLYLGNNLISGVATPVDGGRSMGQRITSDFPLVDAGLHLLDGGEIDNKGIYTDFVNYVYDLYESDPSRDCFIQEMTMKNYNYNNYGVTKIDNGVISGYTAKINYFSIPSHTPSSLMELVLKIKATALVANSDIISRTASAKGIVLRIVNATTGQLNAWVGNGSSDVVSNLNTNLKLIADEYAYIKIVWDGATYKFFSSVDGLEWFDGATKDNATAPFLDYEIFIGGCSTDSYCFNNGYVDLNESYLKLDGETYWFGYTETHYTPEEFWDYNNQNYGFCNKFLVKDVNETYYEVIDTTNDTVYYTNRRHQEGVPNTNVYEYTDDKMILVTKGLMVPDDSYIVGENGVNYYFNNMSIPYNKKVVKLPKIQTRERKLIKSYSFGDDWYNLYSDGWIEQGGITAGSTVASKFVTFEKPFKDASYSLSFAAGFANTGVATYTPYVNLNSKTSTGFNLIDHNTATIRTQWIARGYIELEDYPVDFKYNYIVIANQIVPEIEVDINEIVTDLNSKVGRDELTEVKVVIETYNNGSNWYRVWSDGWIEQGGRVTNAASSGILTYLKSFSNTRYTLVSSEGETGTAESSGSDTAGYGENMGFTNFTKNSSRYSIVSGRYFNWYACGY